MMTFIENYLLDPTQAIADAAKASLEWSDNIGEEQIYAQIASPEFRLYEAVVFSQPLMADDARPTLYP